MSEHFIELGLNNAGPEPESGESRSSSQLKNKSRRKFLEEAGSAAAGLVGVGALGAGVRAQETRPRSVAEEQKKFEKLNQDQVETPQARKSKLFVNFSAPSNLVSKEAMRLSLEGWFAGLSTYEITHQRVPATSNGYELYVTSNAAFDSEDPNLWKDDLGKLGGGVVDNIPVIGREMRNKIERRHFKQGVTFTVNYRTIAHVSNRNLPNLKKRISEIYENGQVNDSFSLVFDTKISTGSVKGEYDVEIVSVKNAQGETRPLGIKMNGLPSNSYRVRLQEKMFEIAFAPDSPVKESINGIVNKLSKVQAEFLEFRNQSSASKVK